MIKLDNVSKFYYSNGLISTGFSKVSVEFNIGEFVAITGESGSGKSTLLNVISGLDGYDEGEMYIEGKESSHYSEKDYENYRRKYIGNIYQNFNLVNSYTVYQNIELVMQLNGYKHKEIKKKVNELIHTVNLDAFKNTKVSKLSGGQKQRVAIARALAKETPIIIADEPTGSLDIKAANEIFELLHRISKDKLVIIVTHNYEQVEPYVTRKIRMHDGKILEDLVIMPTEYKEEQKVHDFKSLSLLNTIRLGWRNTFNIKAKFILLLIVFLFINSALISEYSFFKKQEFNTSIDGYNYYFNDTTNSRIVLKKSDNSAFSDDDFNALANIDNINNVVKNDLSIGNYIQIASEDEVYWLYGTMNSMDDFDGTVDYGSVPVNENEIVIKMYSQEYMEEEYDTIINSNFYFYNETSGTLNKSAAYKITGIQFDDESWDDAFYVPDSVIDQYTYSINQQYSTLVTTFEGMYFETSMYNGGEVTITASSLVPQGGCYVYSSFQEYSRDGKTIIGKPLSIKVENLYYTDSISLVVNNIYDENNCQKVLGISKDLLDTTKIYINSEDYKLLFDKPSYQCSVYVDNVHKIEDTAKTLEEIGMTPLVIKDSLVTYSANQIMQIIRTVATILLVIGLFFISYFVIRIIYKSRNTYYVIVRMLGGSQRVLRHLLITELLLISIITDGVVMLAIYLQTKGYYSISLISTALEYLKQNDYMILFSLPVLMALLMALRYASHLFKNSSMATLKED